MENAVKEGERGEGNFHSWQIDSCIWLSKELCCLIGALHTFDFFSIGRMNSTQFSYTQQLFFFPRATHEQGRAKIQSNIPVLYSYKDQGSGGGCFEQDLELRSRKTSRFYSRRFQNSWKNKLVDPSPNDLRSAGFTKALHNGHVRSLSNLKKP